MNKWSPEHIRFPQVAFRRIMRPVKRAVPTGAQIVTAYTDGVVTLRTNRRTDGYHEAADLSSYQGVEVGDFVVHGLDILRGSAGVSDSRGAMSPVCTVCVPSPDVDPRFIGYVIRAQAEAGLTRALARGIREGGADFRRWETLADLPVPCPPLEIQSQLADYLDSETKLLDGVARKNEAMIELLHERSRSALEHMLQAAAGPKPQLRHVAELVPGHAFKSDDFVDEPEGVVRLLRGINVSPQGVDWSAETVWLSRHPVGLERYRLQLGDVVVGMDRPWISTGVRAAGIHRDDIPSYLVQRVLRVVPGAELDSRYCLLALRSDRFYAHFEPDMTGVSVPHVSAEQIGGFRIPLPGLKEQQEIAGALQESAADSGSISDALKLQNALLTERRQALITAAVTGQLDIGEAA